MAISKRKTKDGKIRYQVRIFDNYDIVATKTFRNKSLAKEFEAKGDTKVHENRARGIKDCYLTFTEFWNQIYLPEANDRLGAATLKTYKNLYYRFIEPVFGGKMMAKTMAQEISQFLYSIKGDAVYVNKIRQVLAILYNRGIKLQVFTYNPLIAVPQLTETTDRDDFRWWEQADVKKFLDWCRETKCPRYLMYKMAVEEGGMRPQEVIALQRDQINLEIGRYRVCRSYNRTLKSVVDNTKTNEPRTVRLSKRFCELIRAHLKTHSSEFLFPNSKGTHYQYENLKNLFRKDCAKADVPYIGLNGLRHTFASHFIMTVKDKVALAEIMGHVSNEMQRRYVHLSEDYMSRYCGALDFEETDKNVIQFPQVSQEDSGLSARSASRTSEN